MSDFYNWRELMEQIRDGQDIDLGTEETQPISCPICEGLGVIRYNVPIDDLRFGKLFPCPEPDCPAVGSQKREQVEAIAKKSSWEDSYDELTFDTFRRLMDKTHKGNWTDKRGAFAAAFMFAMNDGRPFDLTEAGQAAFSMPWPDAERRRSNSVVLIGDVGTGKTGLAIAACNLLKQLGKVYLFIRTMQMIRNIQDTYSKIDNGPEGSTVYQYKLYSTVPFLILDEFGVKNFSRDRLEIVETIIRDRDRANLPTLITTNLTVDQISDEEYWDKQIGDIVKKAHCVNVGGVKLRQTARKAATW